MDVLIVVDMQEGMLLGEPKHDLPAVVDRINRLADRTRRGGGSVVLVQHQGAPGDDLARSSPGWQFLSSIDRQPADAVVAKTLNDAFFGTSLQADLIRLAADRLLIAGWATDFCVDATVRSAAALGFQVVVVSDAHTLSDRPHLSAERVIEHHHFVWTNLISPHPVALVRAAEI